MSSMLPDVLDLLRCPACRDALVIEAGKTLECGACGTSYPIAAGLPWLYRDVEGSRTQWAGKLQQFRKEVLSELDALTRAEARDDLTDATRERLRRQKEGLEGFGEQVFGLFEPFGLREAEAGATLPRDRIPSAQHVTSYVETAFRDWRWGDEELAETTALIDPLVRDATGAAVVVGGGAGRFAWDLAQTARDLRVIQLDLNPLLSRIGARVVHGESVVLNELPRFPQSVEDACVEQRLVMPESLVDDPKPCFVLGDAFAPPFADESFDFLVTPWLVDIVPEPFPALARRLARWLAPGGRWISFGPTSFEAQSPGDRLTPEEMAEVLEGQGFELRTAGTESVPYLHSPHAMPRRAEEIFVFEAVRPEALQPVEDWQLYPEWMVDGRVAIPEDPRFEAMRAERTFDLEILKSIDGRSSIEDLVVILSSRYGLAPDRCRAQIDRFFARWFEVD